MDTKSRILVLSRGSIDNLVIRHIAKSKKVDRIYAPEVSPIELPDTGYKLERFDARKPDEILAFCMEKKVLFAAAFDEAASASVVDALRKKGFPVLGPPGELMRIAGDARAERRFLGHLFPNEYEYHGDNELTAAGTAEEYLERGPVVVRTSKTSGKAYFCRNKSEASAALRALKGEYFVEEAADPEKTLFYNLMFLLTERNILPFSVLEYRKSVRKQVLSAVKSGYRLSSLTSLLQRNIYDDVVLPLRDTLREKSLDYKGFLTIEVALEGSLMPRLSEFCPSLQEPAASLVLGRLKSDFFDYLEACATGRFAKLKAPVWA